MKFYELEIETLEPVILGYDNTNESRDIISGTALRGLFIKENLKFSNNKEELILSKDIIFTDAYIKKGKDYFFPTPKCFLCDKHDMKSLKKDKEELIKIKNCLFKINENIPGKTMTEGIGKRFVTKNEKLLKTASVKKIENMHINKSIQEGENSLYRYEAIAKGQKFYSLVIIKDNEIISEKDLKKIKKINFIGKSRSSGYGKINISSIIKISYKEYKEKLNIEVKENENYLNIYFLTDAILKDKCGNTVSILPKEEIKELFGLEVLDTNDQFVTNKIIGGYNSFQKIALPKETAIAAGSIIRYKLENSGKEKLIEKINKIEENGLGYFRERGFGRIIINPDFDQEILENYKAEDKKNTEVKVLKVIDKVLKVIDKDEEKMVGIIKSWKEEQDKTNETEKLIVNEELLNQIIKINGISNSQINQLIKLLESENIEMGNTGLTKDKVYKDRDKISIFGNSANTFINKLNTKDIQNYINNIEKKPGKKIKIEDNKEKIQFITRLVREGLYFKLRGARK